MNRFLWAGIAAGVLVALFIGANSVFIVDQWSQALVQQFGETIRTVSEPGLQFKKPFVQNVVIYSKQVLDFDPPPQEVIAESWKFGEEVMVEPYIAGKELTSAVLGDRALAVTEITAATGFYDYEAKYGEGGSRHGLQRYGRRQRHNSRI